ncbi:glycosyltransferase [Vulcanisaeta sp. JCM 16161]|uniref:glycosyltransferase n=1 Tax=Vulcanisaeta sp. JCM 16161 TaxID=1295372 RepID=UPI0006D0D16C|nr:glycosyltransferase [Vulcanisaeta sp. JCM 16161]
MANMTYMAMANASISVDHATYEFARKIYPILRRRLFKLYPPYGYLVQDEPNKIDELALAKLDRIKDDYVLGFTSLSKTGAYLKFEARPHAIVLYLIAKRLRNINVVMAGSSLNDWNRVFPGIKPPPNLHLIDGGFSDKILGTLYSRARLVIIPITNRSISNRLLEALFFSKAVITSEVVKFIHPELRHKEHVYISNWDTIVEDTIKLMNDWDMIKRLEKGAREAYVRYFSTKINLRFVDKLLKAFDIV